MSEADQSMEIFITGKCHQTTCAVSIVADCRKLEEQLKETQVAKDELVAQQQELHEMMIRLKINSYIYQSSIQSMILEVDFFKHRF